MVNRDWQALLKLGAKLAAPEREVITTISDDSHMFGNPLAHRPREGKRSSFGCLDR